MNEKPIIITDHAAERIRERMLTRTDKLAKVARKAWVSMVNRRTIDGKMYREFSGRVFVFVENPEQGVNVLVTVLNPKEEFAYGKLIMRWDVLNSAKSFPTKKT